MLICINCRVCWFILWILADENCTDSFIIHEFAVNICAIFRPPSCFHHLASAIQNNKHMFFSSTVVIRIHVHCTEYMYIVKNTCTLYRIHVHCTEYMYTVQNTCTLYRTHVHCTEHMYTVQNTCTLYSGIISCPHFFFQSRNVSRDLKNK